VEFPPPSPIEGKTPFFSQTSCSQPPSIFALLVPFPLHLHFTKLLREESTMPSPGTYGQTPCIFFFCNSARLCFPDWWDRRLLAILHSFFTSMTSNPPHPKKPPLSKISFTSWSLPDNPISCTYQVTALSWCSISPERQYLVTIKSPTPPCRLVVSSCCIRPPSHNFFTVLPSTSPPFCFLPGSIVLTPTASLFPQQNNMYPFAVSGLLRLLTIYLPPPVR